MGFYINPPDESKEDWLVTHGKVVLNTFTWDELPPNKLPVVLIDNGAFTAAGIAYSEKEFEAFTTTTDEDDRARIIFIVDIADLLDVCPHLSGML